MSPMKKQRLFLLAVALAPLAAALLARTVVPVQGPSPALAAGVSDVAPIKIAPAANSLTPEQARLASIAAEMKTQPFGSSPFDPIVGPPLVLDEPAPSNSNNFEPAAAAAPEPPKCRLTSIMAGRTPVATINGRARRVGELIAPEWSVGAIDALQGTVTILHSGGHTVTLHLRPQREGGIPGTDGAPR